jgi:Tfp pilus assembly protein PilF
MLAGYEPAVQMTRFNHPARDGFTEVINVEVTLRPKAQPAPAAPGTSFVQDVPKAARAAYEKAMAQLRAGQAAAGIAALREALSIFDDYFDAQFALGLALYRAGKYDEALPPLERARQINDRAAPVYHLFGLVMVKQKKFAVAEYGFREAIRLNPNNAESHMYRGLVLVELAGRGDEKQRAKDMAEAEQELSRALELDGKLGPAYLQRAMLRKRKGDREGAARDLESYLSVTPYEKNAAAIREEIARLRGQKQ